MFNEFFFRPGKRAVPASAEDLQRLLADELGSPLSVHLHEGGTRLEFVDFGITLTLAFDEEGVLEGAATVLPNSLEIKHVTAMRLAFKRLGWVV